MDITTGSITRTHAIGNFNVGDVDFAPDGYIYHTNYSWALFRIDPITVTQTFIGFGNLGSLHGIASLRSTSEPPWSFAHITDTHIGGYKIVFDSKGKLISERSIADIKEIRNQFTTSEFETLQTILRIAKLELDKVHNLIEANLNARRMKDR